MTQAIIAHQILQILENLCAQLAHIVSQAQVNHYNARVVHIQMCQHQVIAQNAHLVFFVQMELMTTQSLSVQMAPIVQEGQKMVMIICVSLGHIILQLE